MKVKIKEGSFLARIAAAKLRAKKVAIVFGNTIHLHNTSREEFLRDRHWVRHELKHVEQYKQYGVTGFVARYLFSTLKNGYTNNRFEIDARSAETDDQMAYGVEFT